MKTNYITKTEEYRLIHIAQSSGKHGVSARNKLIVANLSFIKMVVSYYSCDGPGLDYDDLFQEATMEFVEAINQFEFRPKLRLRRYAAYRIKLRLSGAIAQSSGGVKLPQRIYWEIKKIEKLVRNHHLSYYKYPTIREIGLQLNFPVKKVKRLLFMRSSLLLCENFDSITIKKSDTTLLNCPTQKTIDEHREIDDLQKALSSCLNSLPSHFRSRSNVRPHSFTFNNI